MDRRALLILGSLATALPLVARAQQKAMPVIGFLGATATWDAPDHDAAFHAGLAEAGYTEGRNVAIDYNWCDGQYDRLPGMAGNLVRRAVTVIVAWGYPPLDAARHATTEIPIVFYYGGDPVRDGIVPSLNQPGGNITGATLLTMRSGEAPPGFCRTFVPEGDPDRSHDQSAKPDGADASRRRRGGRRRSRHQNDSRQRVGRTGNRTGLRQACRTSGGRNDASARPLSFRLARKARPQPQTSVASPRSTAIRSGQRPEV